MPYMVTFTINIPPMLVYIPYMDPMGIEIGNFQGIHVRFEAGATWPCCLFRAGPACNVATSVHLEGSIA